MASCSLPPWLSTASAMPEGSPNRGTRFRCGSLLSDGAHLQQVEKVADTMTPFFWLLAIFPPFLSSRSLTFSSLLWEPGFSDSSRHFQVYRFILPLFTVFGSGNKCGKTQHSVKSTIIDVRYALLLVSQTSEKWQAAHLILYTTCFRDSYKDSCKRKMC